MEPSPEPSLDVVLHHAQYGFWDAWGPSIVTAVASLLVALIALRAALASAERSAEATRAAAERSARSLLDAEGARAAIEDARYIRALIADVAAAARERSLLAFRFAVIRNQNANLWTEEDQQRHEQAVSTLGRTIALVRLTTKDSRIHAALNGVANADKAIQDAFKPLPGQIRVTDEMLVAVTTACTALDSAIGGMIEQAAKRLGTD